jgi:hypothetical protein
MSEQQPKLHVDGKIISSPFYAQRNLMLQYSIIDRKLFSTSDYFIGHIILDFDACSSFCK